MSDRINKEEFVYWVKATVALQIAKEGTFEYIKNVMTAFLQKLENVTSDSDHFNRFIKKIAVDGRVKKEHLTKRGGEFKWAIATDCTDCKTMFEMLRDESDPSYRWVHWKCHSSSSTISPSVYWWIISKFYISYNIENSLGPQEVDAVAVFSLMTLCTLFAHIKGRVVALIDLRNKLMHNKDNTLSKKELEDSFTLIKSFLQDESIRPTSEDAMSEIIKLEKKQLLIVGVNEECHELVRRALLLKKQSLEHDMEMERSVGNSIDKYEDLLKHTNTEIEKETQNVYGVERRKTEEIYKLKADIQHLETDLNTEQREKQLLKSQLEASEARVTEAMNIQVMLMHKIQTLESQREQEMDRNRTLRSEVYELKEQMDQLKTRNADRSFYADCARGVSVGSMTGAVGAGVPGAVVGGVIGGTVQATINVVDRVLHRDN